MPNLTIAFFMLSPPLHVGQKHEKGKGKIGEQHHEDVIVQVYLVSVIYNYINICLSLESKIFGRLRTSGGRSVNTWRMSPPLCLYCVQPTRGIETTSSFLGSRVINPARVWVSNPKLRCDLVRSVSSRVK